MLAMLLAFVASTTAAQADSGESSPKVSASGEIPDPIADLQSPDCARRRAAATALSHYQPVPQEALMPLNAALINDDDCIVQREYPGESATAVIDIVKAIAGWVNPPLEPSLEYSVKNLGYLGQPAVPALTAALNSDIVPLREGAAQALGQIKPLPREAVNALTLALRDKSASMRYKAAHALLWAGVEVGHQSNKEQRPYTMRDITAAIPASDGYEYPAPLAALLTLDAWNMNREAPAFLFTVHRGKKRPDRLSFWRKTDGDEYELLQVMETEDFGPGGFGTPTFFDSGSNSLCRGGTNCVIVPNYLLGPSGPASYMIFYADQTSSGGLELKQLMFESAEQWYQDKLLAGEEIRNPSATSVAGGKLRFDFDIWKPGDALCCPTAGHVSGTYQIIAQSQPVTMRMRNGVRGVSGYTPPGVSSVDAVVIHSGNLSDLSPRMVMRMVVENATRTPSRNNAAR